MSNPASQSENGRVVTQTIAFTAGESDVIDTKGRVLIGVNLPAVGANNATLTFKGADTEGASSFTVLVDSANTTLSATVDVAATKRVQFGSALINQLAGERFIKLVNTGETESWEVRTRFIE